MFLCNMIIYIKCVWFVCWVCELCTCCCIQHALWWIRSPGYLLCVSVSLYFYFRAVFLFFFTVLCVKHADGCQIEAQVIVMRANSWIKSIVCWDSDERKDGNAKNKRAMFVSVNPAVVFYWYHIRDQVINVVFFSLSLIWKYLISFTQALQTGLPDNLRIYSSTGEG